MRCPSKEVEMISKPRGRQMELYAGETRANGTGPQRKIRMLVANEPRSYREVIGTTLQALKPNVEVLIIEPEELDREVERSTPDLVLCSHLTPTVEDEVPVWVELYPDGESLVTMSIDGLRMTAMDDIGLHHLLWIVDRAEVLAQRSYGRRS
jgi:hypothetical protein